MNKVKIDLYNLIHLSQYEFNPTTQEYTIFDITHKLNTNPIRN